MNHTEEILYRDRKGTDCNKWDSLEDRFGASDLIPLWVADMDFEAPACVREALAACGQNGLFGYYRVPERYFQAFISWEKKYHGYEVRREWLRYSPGVVAALNWLVQILTQPGDGVGVMTPVYYPFMNAVNDNGRTLVDCPLLEENGIYRMDMERFERLAAEGRMKLFILCSPHNPVGRVWTEEELRGLLDCCRKYGIYVLADEIHHDLIVGDKPHTAAAAAGDYSDMLVTVTAASKTFNLAALKNSVVVIPDAKVREKWDAFTGRLHVTDGGMMGYVAVAAAYEGGRDWLDGVLSIVKANADCLRGILAEGLPEAVMSPLEGTYLAWVNLAAYVKPEDMKQVVQDEAKLAVDYGDWFGGADYASFIRINLATSEENIRRAGQQLCRAVEKYRKAQEQKQ